MWKYTEDIRAKRGTDPAGTNSYLAKNFAAGFQNPCDTEKKRMAEVRKAAELNKLGEIK